MVMRKIIFASNEFYHIFNRTVGRELIFNNKHHTDRALKTIDFYRFSPQLSYSKLLTFNNDIRIGILKRIYAASPLVEIYAYSLMPNHMHFVIKQCVKNGLQMFISNFQNSFARYFNTKLERHGALFCHSFQAVRVENEQTFLHVVRYVHLNHITSYLMDFDNLEYSELSSLSAYLGNVKCSFLSKEILLSYLHGKKLKDFTRNQIDYQRSLKKIKDMIIE